MAKNKKAPEINASSQADIAFTVLIFFLVVSTMDIDTGIVRVFIQDVVKRYQPSSKKGVLRISYGVQSSIAPVEFIFFLNNTSLISDNYRQYISNRLREYFHYEGVPIKIIYKEK